MNITQKHQSALVLCGTVLLVAGICNLADIDSILFNLCMSDRTQEVSEQ